MNTIPINTDTSPTVILELIYRLKVRDVMTGKLFTRSPHDSLRSIQLFMREKGITGVPITENKRVLGIISMQDIIEAFDGGYIDSEAEKYMSRKLIVLENDMPLSLAISYFDKFHYHRFPVLNKKREIVGMISSRDITNRLLVEINKELAQLEYKLAKPEKCDIGHIQRIFNAAKFDFENAGKASTEIKKLLKTNQFSPKLIRRVAIASYELEMNMVVHSNGGNLICLLTPELIEITARDTGPGIDDIDKAMEVGFSTANEWIRSLGFGAGMGLPNVKNVSDEFSIKSSADGGTVVKAIINIE